MVLRERLLSILRNNGLMEGIEAECVLRLFLACEPGRELRSKMGDDASAVSEKDLHEFMKEIRPVALEWLDTYKPHHWARTNFEPVPEAAKVEVSK